VINATNSASGRATAPQFLTFPATRRRFIGASKATLANTLVWWLAAFAIITIFAAVRRYATEAGMPVYGDGIETHLFGGLPTLWIQRHVYTLWPSGLSWAFVVIHGSWFFTPFAAIGLVTAFRNKRLGSLIGWWAALNVVVHLSFIVFPTEPPWMVNPDVIRVVATRVGPIQDSNPLAAMPSLHVALPLVFGLWFFRERWLAPAWGFTAFSAIIALEVVSSGEHYVVDVIGAILACVAVAVLAPRIAVHVRAVAVLARERISRFRPRRLIPRLGSSESGQALIEFAFILPIMLVFLLVLVDFGLALDHREVIQHAVREGARYGAVHEDTNAIITDTVNQSEGVLDTTNVSVCYNTGPDGEAAGNVGSYVRVAIKDYSYKFSVGSGELLKTLGIGAPSIAMNPTAEARLETPVLGATPC
jgi:PAP2 superfamily/TadE-like protein